MIESLGETVKSVLPSVVGEFNTTLLPAIETAWGRKFKDELENENQKTVEIAKNYARPLNNCFYRHINEQQPTFLEKTIDGSDYVFNDILVEDKNSFSTGNCWVGNGYKKTDIHLLKKFECDEDGKIIKAFIGIVSMKQVLGDWTDRTLQSHRSVLKFLNQDIDKIYVVHGSIRPAKKYLQFELEVI